MTAAYAVALLRAAGPQEGVVRYLEGIDATLAPFGGRYLVHGDPPTVLEGEWPGDLVVIAFPDRARAEAWYASDAYREILPLRRSGVAGPVVLIDGVPPGHRATDILTR
ncbi:DUF1330 domain-containing protein [Streptomyces sp. NPDC049879]|uniref:DUF1330 domain-containing protein n=1 Tax=Streptomyces sp. NPDC049879 TaxID=3365598 RepID=UPI003799EF90